MRITIAELQDHSINYNEDLAPGVIDFGPDWKQTRALKADGSAQLVEEHESKHKSILDIRLVGKLATALETPCARCLDPVQIDIKREFDLLYRPLGVDSGREEVSVTSAEAEVGYYEGDGILLEDALREQVLLEAPIRAICREDCKGLCPHCGANLNQQQCSCAEPLEDPRWAALKDIRSKLES